MANGIPQRETPKAHAAFELYWSLGDGRTCAKVGDALGKSTTLIEGWSARHHWQARVIARQDQLEAEREQLRKESRTAAIEANDGELVTMGQEGMRLAFAVLKARAEAGQMGAVAAVQFLTLAVKMTLRGYREPETITRQEHTGAGGSAIRQEMKQTGDFDFATFLRLFGSVARVGSGDAAPTDGARQPMDPA